jgi:hypothetical protein
MSTPTNFKRIALVAVAALGLGVLSSVPSNAAFNVDSFTVSTTSAAQSTAETYTSSSATATLAFLAGAASESISVTASLKTRPSTSAVAYPFLQLVETTNATTGRTGASTSFTAGVTYRANDVVNVGAIAAGNSSTKFAVYLAGSATDTTTAPATAGTYVVTLTRAAVGASGTLVGGTTTDLTIVVSDSPALATLASASTSKVFIQGTTAAGYVATTDSAVAAAKTAATASVGFLYILPSNAAATTAAAESLTVTTTVGSLQTTQNTPLGRSLVVKGVGTAPTYVYISPDGTGGTAKITVTSASGVLLSTKTMTFSGTATKFGTAAVPATSASVIAAAGTTTVAVAAQDVDGNVAPDATVYAFSSDTTKVTVPATALTWNSTTNFPVTVTGVAAGTATITFGNASTLAASTFKSNAVTVRVGSATPANVKVALDKASYAPGEVATVTLTVVDSDGLAVVGGAVTSIFATGGISVAATLGSNSDTLTATGFTVSSLTNTKTYTVYMPVSGGNVKFSWTGGTSLATANQVAGSTTVAVNDAASAALAAVTALATTVASLKTLITTLTNLVLKIQKKVKA